MFTAQSVETHRTENAFRRAAVRNQALIESVGLDVRVGKYLGCPVLKIDKPAWNNRGEVAIPGEIFFSIWMKEKGRLCYNIHALKLRHLTAYKLQSREFAVAFRARFDSGGWPNVSMDFGPQTLMQGWITSEGEIDELIERFCGMHSLIDELLDGED